MADLKNGCPPENGGFKEAVCVDAGRVYDSCCEQNITLCIYNNQYIYSAVFAYLVLLCVYIVDS